MTVPTTSFTVSNAAWVDLGAGPMEILVGTEPAAFIIADVQPADSDQGFGLSNTVMPVPLQTMSHVWARGTGSAGVPATVIATPIPSPIASIGSPADQPWTGVGPASLIAVMKAVFLGGGSSTSTGSTSAGNTTSNVAAGAIAFEQAGNFYSWA